VPNELYLEEYIILPDPKGPVTVWRVNGKLVRSYYKTDYTEGGHGYVYRWVPKPEIWIEDGVDDREVPFIIAHEYLERRLMRDRGMEYDPAHEVASRVEFDLRKAAGATPLLTRHGRKLTKRDLPKVTADAVYDFVLKRYVREK
jgi:hypothetical protein